MSPISTRAHLLDSPFLIDLLFLLPSKFVDMATAAVLSSTQISTNSPFDAALRRGNDLLKLRIPKPSIHKTSPSGRIPLARASSNGKPPFTFQEDLNYVAKLGGGSVVGAAAIKYGSVVLPEITRPNIVQALAMISGPVILAVLLLIIQSRAPRK